MIEDKKQWYVANFEMLEKALNGQSRSEIHKLRKQALSTIREKGFPTIKDEEWRFTDIEPIISTWFNRADSSSRLDRDDLKEYLLEEVTQTTLVFVNGFYSPDLSNIDGLENIHIAGLAESFRMQDKKLQPFLGKQVDIHSDAFAALNTAFMQDGVFIHIPDNVVVEEPIHVLFASDARSDSIVTHPRNLIVAGKSAQAKIIESYVGFGENRYFTNPVVEIILEDNAVLDHYKIQRERTTAYHVAVNQIRQARDSAYSSHSFSFGGELVRSNINTILDGEGGESTLNGLYIASGRQHVDNHTVIDHAKPHCSSHELYKGVLDNQARAVFSGKIHVRQAAQKTDAIQSNQNLLLSEDATVDTKPQLEIFADDVKCTHGGTVGQIDDEGVFYLRSRGIDAVSARNMMIQAFAGEVTHKVKIDSLRDHLDELVFSRLHDGHLE